MEGIINVPRWDGDICIAITLLQVSCLCQQVWMYAVRMVLLFPNNNARFLLLPYLLLRR